MTVFTYLVTVIAPYTTYRIWHDFFMQFVFLHLWSKSFWSRLKSIFQVGWSQIHCV